MRFAGVMSGDFIEHVLLVCKLYEGQRFRLFQDVGQVLEINVGGWSEVDKFI